MRILSWKACAKGTMMNIMPLKISASWARKALARQLAARRELSFAGARK